MQPFNDPLATASAKELAAAVRAKSVSALELTDAAIARIEALDGPINAVVVRDFDRARDQARKVDLAVANGAELPLAGVPMTVKETFNVAGLPTTFGLESAKDYRPAEDAAAVRRLKDAGAVILGKTNVPTGLSDYQSDNPIYGRTNNPHDLARSPGARRAGPRRRSRRAWSPWSSAATLAAPSACRRHSAASSDTSRRSTSFPLRVLGRRAAASSRPIAPGRRRARWPAAPRTSSWR